MLTAAARLTPGAQATEPVAASDPHAYFAELVSGLAEYEQPRTALRSSATGQPVLSGGRSRVASPLTVAASLKSRIYEEVLPCSSRGCQGDVARTPRRAALPQHLESLKFLNFNTAALERHGSAGFGLEVIAQSAWGLLTRQVYGGFDTALEVLRVRRLHGPALRSGLRVGDVLVTLNKTWCAMTSLHRQ